MANSRGKPGVTLGKVVLIVGLAATLYYVWPAAEPESTGKAADAPAAAAPPVSGPPVVSVARPGASAASLRRPTFPRYEMADIVARNPFRIEVPAPRVTEAALPEGEPAEALDGPPPTAEPTPEPAATRPVLRVEAVVASGKDRLALIDGVHYREGQILPNGMRVLEITPTRVRVSAKTP